MKSKVILFILTAFALSAEAQVDQYTVRGRLHLQADSFFIYRGDTIIFDYVTQQELRDSLALHPEQNLSSTRSHDTVAVNISGGSGTFFTVSDPDSDPVNELQTISLSGDTLHLSSGGSVKLPPGGDDWGTQTVTAGADSLIRGRGTPGSPLRADTTRLATQHDLSGLGSKWTTGTYGIYRDGRVYVGGPASNTTALFRVTAESGDGTGIWGQAIQSYSTQNGLTIYAGSTGSQSLLKASTSAGVNRLELKADGRLTLGAYTGTAMDGAVTRYLGVDAGGQVFSSDPSSASLWTDGGSYLYASGLEDLYFPSSRAISWRNLSGGVGAENYFRIIPNTLGSSLSIKYGAADTEVFSVNAWGGARFANAFAFPTTDGAGGQVLMTNGSGSVSWSAEGDGSVVNELNSGMTWTDATNTLGVTDAGGTKGVSITGFLETEADGSVTNEGSLTVAAGSGSTSVINSNTSGSAGVTLTAGTGLGITESGNTITLTNSLPDQAVSITGGGINAVSGSYPSFTVTGTEVDGSTTNEIQNLSLSGNQLSIAGGTGVNFPNFSTTGTTPGWVKGSNNAGSSHYLDGSGNWTVPAGSGDMLRSTYDNSGTADVIDVENGGTGKSSHTTYTLLAGGTTTTGNLQQVSGTGTSGQILTSNGTGALPSWQNAPSGADNWGTQYVILNSDSLIRGRGTTGSPLKADTTRLATQYDLGGMVKQRQVGGTITDLSVPLYWGTSGQLLDESPLYFNSYGKLNQEVSLSGYPAMNIRNTSASGVGLTVSAGGSSTNILALQDYSGTQRFYVSGQGYVYAPTLGSSATTNFLYYDTSQGRFTWGPPGTAVQSLSGTPITLNYLNGPNLSVTLSSNTTLNITNIPAGGWGSLLVKQSVAGGLTLTINTYSDSGSVPITRITVGAVTSINAASQKFTRVDYKSFGDTVTLEFIQQP